MATEIERLVTDLDHNNALLGEAESLAPGLEVTVAWANEKGYAFSVEELVTHIEEENAQLSDEDLDAISGGIRGAEGAIGPGGIGPRPAPNDGPIGGDDTSHLILFPSYRRGP